MKTLSDRYRAVFFFVIRRFYHISCKFNFLLTKIIANFEQQYDTTLTTNLDFTNKLAI